MSKKWSCSAGYRRMALLAKLAAPGSTSILTVEKQDEPPRRAGRKNGSTRGSCCYFTVELDFVLRAVVSRESAVYLCLATHNRSPAAFVTTPKRDLVWPGTGEPQFHGGAQECILWVLIWQGPVKVDLGMAPGPRVSTQQGGASPEPCQYKTPFGAYRIPAVISRAYCDSQQKLASDGLSLGAFALSSEGFGGGKPGSRGRRSFRHRIITMEEVRFE